MAAKIDADVAAAWGSANPKHEPAQSVAGEPTDGHTNLVIGAQQTAIDRRDVVGTSEAVDVVRASARIPLPPGESERR